MWFFSINKKNLIAIVIFILLGKKKSILSFHSFKLIQEVSFDIWFFQLFQKENQNESTTPKMERKKRMCAFVYVCVSKSSSFINDICMHKNATQKDQRKNDMIVLVESFPCFYVN